jgi:hypothetical protein
MLRLLCASLFVLSLCAWADAAPPQAPRPPQAPPLVGCDCGRTGICTCDPGTCDCPECPCHKYAKPVVLKAEKPPQAPTTYKEARKRCCEEGGRLVVWVGGVCKPCVRELDECEHVAVESFSPCPNGGACLIEGRDGEAYVVQAWDGRFPTVDEVRAAKLRGGRSVTNCEGCSNCPSGGCAFPGACGVAGCPSCGPGGCVSCGQMAFGSGCASCGGGGPMMMGGCSGGSCGGGGCASCGGGRGFFGRRR